MPIYQNTCFIYIYAHIYNHVYTFMPMECLGPFCTAALFMSLLQGCIGARLEFWFQSAPSSFLELPGISMSPIFPSLQSQNSCPQEEVPAGLMAGWLLV